MSKKQRQPAIVAGLGRPETPEETAARKANDSRLYRQRKTVNNLVYSLIISLGLVVFIVLMAPGLTGGKNVFEEYSADVAEEAVTASATAGRPLIAPEPGEGWKAKHAGLRTVDGITSWQVDFTTAAGAYAAVVQAFTADGAPVAPEWIAKQLEEQAPTGAEQLAGVDWVVYDHTDRSADSANMLFGLQSEIEGETFLVYGTDSPETLRALAAQVVVEAEETLGEAAQ